jgi:hypothetical protein
LPPPRRNTVGQAAFNIVYYSYKTHSMAATWLGPAAIYLFAVRLGLARTVVALHVVAHPLHTLYQIG